MEDLSYRFLSNTPIGEDLFAGKSQENIAVILSNVLIEEDFQIIGIDGGWGTGKSNLVKIVEKKLIKSHNFFIYDVWGHQEDDQRKSILVELTEYIADSTRGLAIEHDKWKEKLGRLLSKEKTVTTTSVPFLSIGFILSLILIIYVPTVNTFAKDIPNLWWKYLIVLAPVALWLIMYIVKFISNLKRFKNERFWNCVQHTLKLSLQQTMQIYGNKQTDETKFETISEKEPSVKDFRDWMRNIDGDLETNKKKLVIVFDNFDRLSKKHIQSIWSSIHIFFADEKYNNIKVIIPFDRTHIRNAFSELNSNDATPVNFANDYINKTFDLVYRVSPPIMSNWKKFFYDCWKKAVQGHFNLNEYLKVEQVFDAYANPITPREIISFINELISVKILHLKIPERFIGIFVLNKDKILENPLKAITQGEFLGPLSYLYRDDDKFQRYITSLSYQIDPDEAMEIVYRKQLKDSLANEDNKVLNEIAKTEVFPKILLGVLQELENLESPIVVLSKLSSDAEISSDELDSIWDNIYMIERERPFSDFNLKESHKILFKRINSEFKTQFVQSHLIALKKSNDFTAVKYAEIVDEYVKIDKEANFGINVFKFLSLKIAGVDDFIEFVKSKANDYQMYKISVNETSLNETLSQVAANDFSNMEFVQYLTENYKLNSFRESIAEKIRDNKSDVENLGILYKVLKYLAKNNGPINILLSDAGIHDLYGQTEAGEEFDYDLLAMRISRGNKFNASYRLSFDEDLENNNSEFVQKIAERIEYFISYGELLKSSISFSSPLMISIVQHLVGNRYQSQYARVTELILQFEQICESNGLDPELFINDLSNWEVPEFDNSFIESIPELFFNAALKSETELAKESLVALGKYFDKLSEDEWLKVFQNTKARGFNLLRLTGYKEWNSTSIEAFKAVLTEMCVNGIVGDKENLDYAINSFESSGKDLSNAFKNLRDEFVSGRATMTKELFFFFGENLFKHAELEEKADDVFRRILISAILVDDDCLKILVRHKATIKQLFKESKPKSNSEFKDAIREKIQTNSLVYELSVYLGIKPPKKEKEGKTQK